MSQQQEQDSPNTSEILGDVLSLQSKYPDKPPADSIDCKPNNIKDLKPGPGFSNNLRDLMANIKIEITEQPATNKLRFRYESEGRSAGTLLGRNTTNKTKTYPTLKIIGYQGKAYVKVTCVSENAPYVVHPNNLVGKLCEKGGVCILPFGLVLGNEMTAVLKNVGIQCVKKNNIEESLISKKALQLDPFNSGYTDNPGEINKINLAAVRLCFQVVLDLPNFGKLPLKPIVSEVIKDNKSYGDLKISNWSDDKAPFEGRKKIMLFTSKISRNDIEIHFKFYNKHLGKEVTIKGDLQSKNVHEQFAIKFFTPGFPDKRMTSTVKAKMFLFKPSNSSTSQPVDFYFYPDKKHVQTKRTKNVTSGLSQTTLNPTLKDLIQNSSPVQSPPVLMETQDSYRNASHQIQSPLERLALHPRTSDYQFDKYVENSINFRYQ